MKKQLALLARCCIGRRNLIRGGRFLLNAGMLRHANDPDSNGEFKLLKEVVAAQLTPPTVIDIGANLGLYTTFASRLLSGKGLLYAAEPCTETFNELVKNTRNLPTPIRYLQVAFSDTVGQSHLFVVAPGAGTNSLEGDTTQSSNTELVQKTSLDTFLETEQIAEATFVKIDTEGHDFAVIRGAAKSLASGRIQALQFEYNWRWIGQRSFLKDAFEIVKGTDYQIGRVTSQGIELYEEWHPKLETLIEDNYAILRKDLRPKVSTFRFNLP